MRIQGDICGLAVAFESHMQRCKQSTAHLARICDTPRLLQEPCAERHDCAVTWRCTCTCCCLLRRFGHACSYQNPSNGTLRCITGDCVVAPESKATIKQTVQSRKGGFDERDGVFRLQGWGSSPERASRVLTLLSRASPVISLAPPPRETLITSRGMRFESLLACMIV